MEGLENYMKCRSCWSDKAYLREEQGIKDTLMAYLGGVPLKCHHCYHKFWVPFFMTWGQRMHPPKLASPQLQTTAAADPWRAPIAQTGKN
jgi:hypothetical protein